MKPIDPPICDKCGIPSLKSYPVLCSTCKAPSAKRYSIKHQKKLKADKHLYKRLYRKYHPFDADDPSKDVSYLKLHIWVAKRLGKPKICDFCRTTEGTFDWSNISGEYKIDLSDWQRLCRKCHHAYDKTKEKRQATMLIKYGTISPRIANKLKNQTQII